VGMPEPEVNQNLLLSIWQSLWSS